MIYRLAEDWRRLAPEKVQTYEFGKDQGVVHDMVDPSQVNQRIDLVYPVWLDLIDGPASQAGQSTY